jgi:S-adenosylmethionine:tRNA-ribosyltransferase-isomerase (queuine synthetase)
MSTQLEKKVLHEPQLDTILMVEKAILESKEYPTRMQLWRSLPKKVQYQTFQRILEYLEASGRITFNTTKILYTGVNNPKLEALMKSSVRIR